MFARILISVNSKVNIVNFAKTMEKRQKGTEIMLAHFQQIVQKELNFTEKNGIKTQLPVKQNEKEMFTKNFVKYMSID